MQVYKKKNYAFRVVEETDLRLLAAHRNNPTTWHYLTSVFPVWPSNQDEWFKTVGNNNMYFITQYRTKDNVPRKPEDVGWLDVGIARINEIDWINRNACVGVDTFEPFRGKGHAVEAFSLLVDYSFNVLGLHRIWLLVAELNEKARKVYEKAGMKYEGKMVEHLYRDGKYLDYLLMGLVDKGT